MPEVPKISTPISAEVAERLLRQAWQDRFNAPVRADVLRNMLALWDLETAAGHSQLNNNWGNIIATRDSQEFYRGLDSGNQRRFRSYATPSAGALALVSQLTSSTRPHWHEGLLTGTPEGFSRGLKNCADDACTTSKGLAYYEAPFDRYTKTLRQRWDKYSHLASGRVGKLKCESVDPDTLPRMPLFPGKRQRWLLVLRATPGISETDREDRVRELFQAWLPLFPGSIGEPEVVPPEEAPTSSLVDPPRLGFRGPDDTVGVEFDYLGRADSMRWPTFVARRRERIDPLCPMSPVDSMPLAVGQPKSEAEGGDPLPPRDRGVRDPIGVTPGIDLGDARSGVNLVAIGLAGVGVGIVLYLLLQRRR